MSETWQLYNAAKSILFRHSSLPLYTNIYDESKIFLTHFIFVYDVMCNLPQHYLISTKHIHSYRSNIWNLTTAIFGIMLKHQYRITCMLESKSNYAIIFMSSQKSYQLLFTTFAYEYVPHSYHLILSRTDAKNSVAIMLKWRDGYHLRQQPTIKLDTRKNIPNHRTCATLNCWCEVNAMSLAIKLHPV